MLCFLIIILSCFPESVNRFCAQCLPRRCRQVYFYACTAGPALHLLSAAHSHARYCTAHFRACTTSPALHLLSAAHSHARYCTAYFQACKACPRFFSKKRKPAGVCRFSPSGLRGVGVFSIDTQPDFFFSGFSCRRRARKSPVRLVSHQRFRKSLVCLMIYQRFRKSLACLMSHQRFRKSLVCLMMLSAQRPNSSMTSFMAPE